MSNRFISREIRIGDLALGGHQPIRIQSMTNTPTLDTEATVEQVIRLQNAGCELVRITAANIREAENLKKIRDRLVEKQIDVPLIADVHFQPKAAEVAARIVEKVRINPGNYTGSHHKGKKYSEAGYQKELNQTARNLIPLLDICKQNNTAIRIGINHGSLSDRILYKYGNTATGMVASALEFIRICREQHFDNLTLSLKASHVPTMIEANRLLVAEMQKQGLDYPLHLGVTEAGNGLDGRIKSAMGIGTLLAEGIGDTVRVSLTEAPEKEIPVARKLVMFYGRKEAKGAFQVSWLPFSEIPSPLQSGIIFINDDEPITGNKKVLILSYPDLSFDDLVLRASADFYLAYEQEKADGILILNGDKTKASQYQPLALGILQASGLKYSKTEFVACPSCGRTHFEIEKELQKVKNRLGNIKGLKIAIMGCFVNGPGEMAGADFGLVGVAPGKVNLYKGSIPLYKNIPEEEALGKLEKLIRDK
jgi:(E)-4-hydroxy-3-methylbut-2-enyl-diphosphate synthase